MKKILNFAITFLLFAFIASAVNANPVVIGAAFASVSLIPVKEIKGLAFAKLGTIGASTTDTIELTYLPANMEFNIGTAPTSIVVTVEGDGVILNLDASGIALMKNLFCVEAKSNQYSFRLANGIVKNKNVLITIANAHAGDLDVYGDMLGVPGIPGGQNGSLYAVYNKALALDGSGARVQDFAVMAVDGLGASDIVNVEYASGNVDNFTGANELDNNVLFRQNYDPNADGVIILNDEQSLSNVQILPSGANRVLYVLDYQPIGNIDNTQ